METKSKVVTYMYSLFFHRLCIPLNIYKSKNREYLHNGLFHGKKMTQSCIRLYLFEEQNYSFDRVFDRARYGCEHSASIKNVISKTCGGSIRSRDVT